MRFRNLRIAWSVAWVAIALLLAVLWLRSYTWTEMYSQTDASHVVQTFGTETGSVFYTYNGPAQGTARRWAYWYVTAKANVKAHAVFRIPIWSLCICAAAAAATPWFAWRFSLRTLLIVTTLVAVWLGLTVLLR